MHNLFVLSRFPNKLSLSVKYQARQPIFKENLKNYMRFRVRKDQGRRFQNSFLLAKGTPATLCYVSYNNNFQLNFSFVSFLYCFISSSRSCLIVK